MNWNPEHWQNKMKKQSKQESFLSILCFYFSVNPVQIQCPSRNSFLKILIYIFCHPWSEGCIVVAFPLQQFGYLHIPSYLLWTPDNLNFWWLKLVLISLEGSSYWELTVVQINNPRTTKGDPITFPVYI